MMIYQQNEAELVAHLSEQVGFLRKSAALYDEGDHAEAKRLALVIRTLCHDTNTSQSLLGQLEVKNSLRFCDSDTISDQPIGEFEDGVVLLAEVSSPLAPISGGPYGMEPLLERSQFSEPKRFDVWWESRVVLTDPRGNRFTRQQVVLSLANKDGGVHIDPVLPESYAAITRQGSLGQVSFSIAEQWDEIIRLNPIPPITRQIAFELDKTLEPIVGQSK